MIWPWLAGSLLLHLLVLASLPGADGPARCPAIMLVSLVSNAAEPKAKVVVQEPVAPPEALQKGTPRLADPPKPKPAARPALHRQARAETKPEDAPAPPTPIVTNNTSAANTIPLPVRPEASAPSKPESTPGPATPGSRQTAPAVGGTPAGSGGQGGTADVPAPVPAKPAVDVKALMAAYGANAAAKVQRAKFFPQSAREYDRKGTTVSVRVKITVARDGSLLSVSASSDIPELSSAAEEAVRRAAPFGSFPAEVDKSSYNFRTTLKYTVN